MNTEMENYVNIEEKYKEKLDNLWKEYSTLPCTEHGYETRKSIKKHAILFVGINPSFSKGKIEEKAHKHVFLDVDEVTEKHSFFSKMIEISKYCKTHNDGKNYPWAELDLLNVRESKQNLVKQLFEKDESREFVERNYNLSLSIIEEAQPQIIVVCNSFARMLLEKSFSLEFDNEIGTFRIKKEGTLYRVPIFFTSMLSGQRALDLGSFRRLEWHIDQVLGKLQRVI